MKIENPLELCSVSLDQETKYDFEPTTCRGPGRTHATVEYVLRVEIRSPDFAAISEAARRIKGWCAT